jgi:hyperosmotically inducible periplasmic protein
LLPVAEKLLFCGDRVLRALLSLTLASATWAFTPSTLSQIAATQGSDASLKAGDQKNSSSDLKLAARIRRAIYKDKSLSTRAHNVTIVVRDGTVTLRGAVDTAAEKDTIQRTAAALAGSAPINDMLTVGTR